LSPEPPTKNGRPRKLRETRLKLRETSSQRRALVKMGGRGTYKRGNRYVVAYRDPTGKQRKRFAKRLAQARVVKAALATGVHRGEYVEEAKTTLRLRRSLDRDLGGADGSRHPRQDPRRLPAPLGFRLDDEGQLIVAARRLRVSMRQVGSASQKTSLSSTRLGGSGE
jgi:hypothetical protein